LTERAEEASARRWRRGAFLAAVLLLATVLRVLYALDRPLGSDEAGVGVLQAAGQAVDYRSRLPVGIAPIERFQGFLAYSEAFSIADVFRSLRHAGMHPPFYYLLLHLVMKLFGNGAFLLRSVSILTSLASVVLIQRLAEELWTPRVGRWAALFSAVSFYGIKYGTAVRPYSLLTLLSVASSLVALRLARSIALAAEKRLLAAFALTTLIGMYSFYHYVFLVGAQLGLVAACHVYDRKALAALGATVALIAVAYLPWLPSLAEQMQKVGSGDFYFHGALEPSAAAYAVVKNNFKGILPDGWVASAAVTLLALAMAHGAWRLLRNAASRPFALAILVYLLTRAAADALLGMKTLAYPAKLFFFVPFSLMLLAAGLDSLPGPRGLRNVALGVCACLLLGSSQLAVRKASEKSGLNAMIARQLEPEHRALVLYNTRNRRYLFPFVHAVKTPVDLMLLDAERVREAGVAFGSLSAYDRVVLVSQYVPSDPDSFVSISELRRINAALARLGFEPRVQDRVGRSPLMVYRRR